MRAQTRSNAVFWDATMFGSCKNRHFGGKYRVYHYHSVLRLLVTANVAPTSQVIVTLKAAATRSSETSVITRHTYRNIQENGILHSHCRENLTSYKMKTYIRLRLTLRK
jgi:hypothetical protein